MMNRLECQTCRSWWCTECKWVGYRAVRLANRCPWCWKATLLSRAVYHRLSTICPVARKAADADAPSV